ncbi:hypothetical protein EDB81DRAFT_623897, partial [Dactylonectria macrodidyma]
NLTFHLFSNLPRELQLHIWDLAVRPDRPAAHHFTVFNALRHDELSALQSHAIGSQSSQNFNLAAPRSDKGDKQSISWTASNPSIYLTDSGLWTACKDSRQAMEKRFDTLSRGRNRREANDYLTTPVRKLPNNPATGTLTSNGETRCFTIYPKTDLICLQPFNMDTVEWRNLRKTVPL